LILPTLPVEVFCEHISLGSCSVPKKRQPARVGHAAGRDVRALACGVHHLAPRHGVVHRKSVYQLSSLDGNPCDLMVSPS
jgi:hypothetical protein